MVPADKGLVGGDFWFYGGEFIGNPGFAGAGEECFGDSPDDGAEGEENKGGAQSGDEESDSGKEVAEGDAKFSAVDIGDDASWNFPEENGDLEDGAEDDELEIVEAGFFNKKYGHEGANHGVDEAVGEQETAVEAKRFDVGDVTGSGVGFA